MPSLASLFSSQPFAPTEAVPLVRALAAQMHAAQTNNQHIGWLTPHSVQAARSPRSGLLEDITLPLTATPETAPVPEKYAWPEMLNSQEQSERNNIYVVGFMLYELLLGPERFHAQFGQIEQSGENEWLKWHLNKAATAPPLQQLIPDFPPSVSDLIARMMHKEQAQRWTSWQELLAATEPKTVAAGGSFMKGVMILAGSSLLLIVAGLVVVFFLLPNSNESTSDNVVAKASPAPSSTPTSTPEPTATTSPEVKSVTNSTPEWIILVKNSEIKGHKEAPISQVKIELAEASNPQKTIASGETDADGTFLNGQIPLPRGRYIAYLSKAECGFNKLRYPFSFPSDNQNPRLIAIQVPCSATPK